MSRPWKILVALLAAGVACSIAYFLLMGDLLDVVVRLLEAVGRFWHR